MFYILLTAFVILIIRVRTNLFYLTFVAFLGLFHIVPTVYGFIVNGHIGPLGIDNYGFTFSHSLVYINVLFIFILSLYLFSKADAFKLDLKLFGKKSFLSCIDDKLFYVLFIFTFAVETSVLLAKTAYVIKYGYQELHIGEFNSGRSVFQIFNHYMFLLLLYYGLYTNKSLVKVFSFLFLIITMFTGMRMPSLILFLVYELYYNRSVLMSKKLFLFIPIIIILTFAIQNFRVGATTEFATFISTDGLANLMFQLFSIFGFTNEIICASIVVKLDSINIGYTNLFSDVINIYNNISHKFSGVGSLPMTLRADSGNLSYQISNYFFTREFLIDGVTAGGSSIAEIYFYMGYLGIFLFGLFYSKVINYLTSLSRVTSFSAFVIYFTFAPYFLKSFRDGAISFLINGFIDLILILSSYLLLKIIFHGKYYKY